MKYFILCLLLTLCFPFSIRSQISDFQSSDVFISRNGDDGLQSVIELQNGKTIMLSSSMDSRYSLCVVDENFSKVKVFNGEKGYRQYGGYEYDGKVYIFEAKKNRKNIEFYKSEFNVDNLSLKRELLSKHDIKIGLNISNGESTSPFF